MNKLEAEFRKKSEREFDKAVKVFGDLYTLKKRIAYSVAFTDYFVATAKNKEFQRLNLKAAYFKCALTKVVKYEQSQCFVVAAKLLSCASPEDFASFISRMNKNVHNPDERRHVNKLKTLRNLRPYIRQDKLLWVDGRLEYQTC